MSKISSDDEKKFVVTRNYLMRSTCLKTQTAATVWKNGRLISAGCNLCAPEELGYGSPVSVCPRLAITTGGQYELCRPVHAEVMAVLNIRAGRDVKEIAPFAGHLSPSEQEIFSAFHKSELKKLAGAILYLVEHYWACENCCHFLQTIGITDIKLDVLSAESTKARYESHGLTKGGSA